MNIGIFINRFVDSGAICISETCTDFRKEGYYAYIYGKNRSENIPREQFKTLGTESEISGEDWWKRKEINLAFFYTLTDFAPKALDSAKRAGAIVVIDTDTDGIISPRVFPRLHLRKYWDPRNGIILSLKSFKAWLHTYRHFKTIEDRVVKNAELADFIRVESEKPAENLRLYFSRIGLTDLTKKIIVIPFAVRSEFTSRSLPDEKSNVIIAAGRLDSQQKNPSLLAGLIKHAAQKLPEWQFELHARSGSALLQQFALNHENVHYFEDTERRALHDRLLRAKIFLSTARFETTPIAALEALCSGCTLFAPKIPGYQSLVTGGKFGRLFASDNARRVGNQLVEFCNNCPEESEGPVNTASYWRERVSLGSVTKQLLSLQNANMHR